MDSVLSEDQGIELYKQLSFLLSNARAWFGELSGLKQLQIPRFLGEKGRTSDTMSLHTFVDASQDAYGAVVYARCTYKDGSVSSNMVAAKNRVAPSISTSIPRLELMAAVVGVRLTTRISKVLEIQLSQSTFWSDSANVLWSIRGRSREFKPFVTNRVGKIQSNTNLDQWRHVPTRLNLADCLSRGLKTTDLVKSKTWWEGPEFLIHTEDTWPINRNSTTPTGDVELKRATASWIEAPSSLRSYGSKVNRSKDPISSVFMTLDANEDTFPLDPSHYSSWLKLKRIQARVTRFIENCQKPKTARTSGQLVTDELKRAEVQLIKQSQRSYFRDEWRTLSYGQPLPKSSKLLGLKPNLADDGLIRSDGRLNGKILGVWR